MIQANGSSGNFLQKLTRFWRKLPEKIPQEILQHSFLFLEEFKYFCGNFFRSL